MLFKIVLGSQIRLLDCRQTLTLEALHAFIEKTFPNLRNYSLYYFDEENYQIIIQTKQDLTVYMEGFDKKPKIHIRKVETEVQIFEKSVVNLPVQEKSNQQKQQSEKVQQAQKKSESIPQPQKVQIYPSLQREEKKQEVQQQKQKNNYILHDVQCKGCQQRPIKNILYKCGRCEELNFCQLCFEKTTHKELHPFAKIRDPKAAPVNVRVNIEQPPIKQEEKKVLQPEKDQKLKYQTEEERQQLIISYLQNLFGPESKQSRYEDFARESRQRTFKRIYQEYISWLNAQNEPGPVRKLFEWIGVNLSKQYNKYMHSHNE